ncbi:MAG: tRNA (guanosine(37)-N1)-methyltransferase TrmD [Gemmatimonadota bacterium]
MRINVVSIFPGYFEAALATSIVGRAAAYGIAEYRLVDLREFTHDRHRTVDDEPYGGGAGMVMKPEPFFEAMDALKPAGPVVLLSPRGRRFDHETAVRYSLAEELTLLCGHYKGVDERVAEALATEELSVGDFVLSGGEPAALVVIDATVRLLPGSIKDHVSAAGDSFYDGLLAPPEYTRPAEYRGLEVPAVLRSGDHREVEEWRKSEARRLTKERRPELWKAEEDSSEDSVA